MEILDETDLYWGVVASPWAHLSEGDQEPVEAARDLDEVV